MSSEDSDDDSLTVVDLFCGCGGFSKGFVDAGFDVLAGVDVWDKAIETYNKNNDHEGLCKDLTKYTPKDFEKDTKIKKFDVLIGGIPCQGFSMGGKRDVNDKRNNLFLEYIKYLNHFKPKAFLIENVIGILSMKNKMVNWSKT